MRAENKKAVIILERDNDMLEKLAEEKTKELFDTHNELEKTKRLSDIGTLAATVAHELRNPLAAIGMAAYNIRRKAANAAIDSHITNIEKKVNESDQIINNLLFYSRIRPPRYEIIDFFDIIAECAAGAEEKCKGRVRIVSDIDMLKNVPIEADPIQMREVINNILNNAIDAVPVPKGFVNIIGEDRSNCICAVFKDNGHGIEAESLAKVFDPFFTTRAKGTGLGLSVCRQIVDLHGGAIEISSNPGEGTSVTVTLPKKKGM
jgi:signal transduction histidine kinase